MRWWFAPFAAALGCSSNSFDIAESRDAAADSNVSTDTNAVVDTSVVEDASTAPDTSTPDTQTLPDTRPLDAGSPDAATTTKCARTGDCAPNHYCKYSGCGATLGVCTPFGALPGPYFDPVCGCDGVTFWNKEFAYVHSVPIAHEGPCTATEKKPCTTVGATCGGTTDSICVFQLPDASVCSAGSPYGSCWRLPTGTLCGTAGGPPMLTCAGTCVSQCNGVKSKTSFYPASCMPG